MLDAKRGALVDPDVADHMRSGIPLCSNQCAAEYDKQEEARQLRRANGHNRYIDAV